MTIKQQGGIFGRNPTFNDVDVEGTLTVDGSVIPSASNIATLNSANEFTQEQEIKIIDATAYDASASDAQVTVGPTLFLNNPANSNATVGGQVVFGLRSSTNYARIGATGGTGRSIFVGVGTSEIARFTANGVTFNGDTAAANALDDYEEGTWTPTLVGASSAGTYSIAASGCTYTKVGRLVTVMGKMTITVSSAGSGSAQFGGLPFTTSGDPVAVGTAISKNVDLDNSTVSLAIQPWTSNTNLFTIVSVRDNSTTSSLDVSGISTGDFIMINTTYIT